MKGQFPMFVLVTSPEVMHGGRSEDDELHGACQGNIVKYLLGTRFDNQPEDGLFFYTPELHEL